MDLFGFVIFINLDVLQSVRKEIHGYPCIVPISFILFSSKFFSSIQTPAVSKALTLVSGAQRKGCNKEKIGEGKGYSKL